MSAPKPSAIGAHLRANLIAEGMLRPGDGAELAGQAAIDMVIDALLADVPVLRILPDDEGDDGRRA